MNDAILPSWNEGPARSAILDFVARVTSEDGPDFVPPAERIATFDNDGTLWCEQPMQVQVFFAQQRLKELAEQYPTLGERQPFKAFLEHDLKSIHELGKQGVFEVAFESHAGMTIEEFIPIVRDWLATARHPTLDRLFVRCTYQPMVELLEYLRANGFRTFIVSGGGIEFIRAFSEQAYGIPPEQVVGSSLKLRFELRDGHGVLVKESELEQLRRPRGEDPEYRPSYRPPTDPRLRQFGRRSRHASLHAQRRGRPAGVAAPSRRCRAGVRL